jgi:anti-sigma regulatory factor (Ser/Thr protein kinase)
METTAVFLAKIELLRPMLQWIHQRLSLMEFDGATLRKIELASEEALVNIIHHAYQNRPEDIHIETKLYPQSHMELVLKDNGPPFDPSKQQTTPAPSTLEDRPIGGLGLHFIHQYMDEVRYKRQGDQNVLILVKKYRNSCC